jgi:hypothetical protein
MTTPSVWPFPLGSPPAQDTNRRKPIPFNPNNHEDAPL